MKCIMLIVIWCLLSCNSAVKVKSEIVGTERVFTITSQQPVKLTGITVYLSGTSKRVWGMGVYPKKSWRESKSEADFLDAANWKTEYRIVYGKLNDEDSREHFAPEPLVRGQKYFIGVSLLPSKYNTTYTFEH